MSGRITVPKGKAPYGSARTAAPRARHQDVYKKYENTSHGGVVDTAADHATANIKGRFKP